MHSSWAVASTISLALSALHPFAASAQDESARPAAAAVMKQFAYFVRDKGVWKQMNDEHIAGENTPVMWVKRIRFEMAGDLVIDRTYAVLEDDSCRPIATIVQSADLNTGKFRSVAFVANGIQFSGTVSAIDDHTSERIAKGRVNADTLINFREITDTSDPNKYTSQMFNPDSEGGWTLRDSSSWEFDPALDVCG